MTRFTFLLITVLSSFGPVKVRVDGEGFLRFMQGDRVVYAKSATLNVRNGELAYADAIILPKISVPADASSLEIDLAGTVSVERGSVRKSIGQLVLARDLQGGPTEPAGSFFSFANRPTLGSPGEGDWGVLRVDGEPPHLAQPSHAIATQPLKGAPPAKLKATSHAGQIATGKVEILVHERSEVHADTYHITDIADVTGPDSLLKRLDQVVFGNTPALGVSRGLDERFLRLRLLGAELDPTQFIIVVPAGATVLRFAQNVDEKQFVDAALNTVKAQFGGAVPLGSQRPINPMRVKEGTVTLEAKDPQKVGSGYSVVVSVLVDGEIQGTRVVQLTANKDAIWVHVGDAITVVLRAGSASVEVPGKVKTAGYVGQRIEVTVTGVGNRPTTHVATLTNAGTAEVNL